MIIELSGEFSVKTLCEHMDVSRSSFYYWKSRLNNPSVRTRNFISNILLFKEYHEKYPSHGYRWLNANYKYKKAGTPCKVYPNLLLSELNVTGPMQCVVSDMTAFYVKGIYYELTIYMDLWNNEILSHSLSSKRGDRMTYISGLESLIELKKQYPEFSTILHSDQGSVYTSKAFNELLPAYNIIRSMSRAGTPTGNGAMEAINGWIKAELFTDLHIMDNENIQNEIEEYIKFFNEERPAYSLNYLTPKQFREYAGLEKN